MAGRSEAQSLGSAARTMKALLITWSLFWCFAWTEADLVGGFLRSLVVCGEPMPHEGQCPTGTVYAGSRCQEVPRGEADWSGSARCFDKNYVVNQAAKFSGKLAVSHQAGRFVALFIGTALLDTTGRRPFILLAFAGSLCAVGVFWAASGFGDSDVQQHAMFGGVFVGALLNMIEPAASAMAADLSDCDAVQRGLRYTALNVCKASAVLVGFVGGFFVLKQDLTDYSGVWTAYVVLGAVFLCLSGCMLQETLPAASRLVAASPCGRCRRSLAELGAGVRIVWKDPFLRYFSACRFIADMAIHGSINTSVPWLIGVLHYSQAAASVAGIVAPLAVVLGSVSSVVLLRRLGPYYTTFLGLACIALAFGLVGIGGPLRGAAPACFWPGWALLQFGFGVLVPSRDAIAGVRVGDDAQGKLFSVSTAVSFFGIMCGAFTWTNVFFVTQANGWRLALGWFVGAGLMLFTLAWSVALYLRYIVPEQQARERRLIFSETSMEGPGLLPVT